MKEYRDKRVIRGLLSRIKQKTQAFPAPLSIMEVCGTHTMTVYRYGLKSMLKEAGIRMISGPGCPVCITPNEYHEAAIHLVAENENYILATFGDMTRVPTKRGSLQTIAPAANSRLKIIYSPEESLELAQAEPGKEVVFFGVGFETTIPAIALTARKAREKRLSNYSILSALWLIPPPLRAILEAKETKIDGFLYPGHVSVIIGRKPYEFIPREFGVPGAITGFEPVDILLGILSIIEQIREGRPQVAIEYRRAVRPEGNQKALSIMEEVLEPRDASWRGLGIIPSSGMLLKKNYQPFDACLKHKLTIKPGSSDLPGCRCGEVLRGVLSPFECALFEEKCSPDYPLGPCMVSFEGACFIAHKYRQR
ncbi:MAG: hydrogenase formation protein HypD [Candidatus Aminicenantales bacterium]